VPPESQTHNAALSGVSSPGQSGIRDAAPQRIKEDGVADGLSLNRQEWKAARLVPEARSWLRRSTIRNLMELNKESQIQNCTGAAKFGASKEPELRARLQGGLCFLRGFCYTL